MSLLASTGLRRTTRTQEPGSSSSVCMRIYRGTARADKCGWGTCAPCPGARQSPLIQLSSSPKYTKRWWKSSRLVSQEPPGQVWASSNPLLPSSSPACSCWQAQNRAGNGLFHYSVHPSVLSTKARKSSSYETTQSSHLFSFTGGRQRGRKYLPQQSSD